MSNTEWEYPEDDWIRMDHLGNFDMNMWIDDRNGSMNITIYPVHNGQTDKLKTIVNYRVTKTSKYDPVDYKKLLC